MATSLQPIYKVNFLSAPHHHRPKRYMYEFVPRASLSTVYSSNDDFANLMLDGFTGCTVTVDSSSGTFYNFPKKSMPFFQLSHGNWGHEEPIHSMKGDETKQFKGDLVERHLEHCQNLERRLEVAGGIKIDDGVSPYLPEEVEHLFAVDVHALPNGELTLETRLRALLGFLPNGFVINGIICREVLLASKAKKSPGGFNREYRATSSDGTSIFFDMPSTQGMQLIELHAELIRNFMSHITSHYRNVREEYDCFLSPAEVFLQNSPGIMSWVSYWDAREQGLRKSAELIAQAIIGASPLKERIKGVVLYGSLARNDKIPRNIDLLLIADSDEKTLNPFNYLRLDGDRNENDIRYDLWELTDGLGRELGIMSLLLSIGTKPKRGIYLEYPDEVSSIFFSKFCAHLNLNVASTKFMADAQEQRKYIQSAFNRAYFQDVLTDGMMYDPQSGKFSIPTRERYASVIQSLEGQLAQVRTEHLANMSNTMPPKA